MDTSTCESSRSEEDGLLDSCHRLEKYLDDGGINEEGKKSLGQNRQAILTLSMLRILNPVMLVFIG